MLTNTKLDLYLHAHAAAAASLNLKTEKEIEAHATKALAEQKIDPAAKIPDPKLIYWRTVFYARRQNMLELLAEPLPT